RSVQFRCGSDGARCAVTAGVLALVLHTVDDAGMPRPQLPTDLFKVVDGGSQLSEQEVGVRWDRHAARGMCQHPGSLLYLTRDPDLSGFLIRNHGVFPLGEASR